MARQVEVGWKGMWGLVAASRKGSIDLTPICHGTSHEAGLGTARQVVMRRKEVGRTDVSCRFGMAWKGLSKWHEVESRSGTGCEGKAGQVVKDRDRIDQVRLGVS